MTVTHSRTRKNMILKQLHSWHWISSAISLVGLLLFALTGITLNHAADISAAPVTQESRSLLPPSLRAAVVAGPGDGAKAPLPAAVAGWVGEFTGRNAGGEAEWSASEVYLSLPRPGGDGWVAIDRITGTVTAETTDRGWISYLNDLHKGRNSGSAWAWFIDIYAGACFVFAATGLALLWLHSARRRSTWPLVGAGLAIPALIAIFLVH